ncbi:hypothetical protein Goari_007708 [Gossypium aridum]|uniref:Uncharacterized protein n=1 Tax=Gossypium aridum TaxID=34290 RepID=A0A7J8XSI1_GOSAI|nr:hypothetical protein [Gossypium aridum]
MVVSIHSVVGDTTTSLASSTKSNAVAADTPCLDGQDNSKESCSPLIGGMFSSSSPSSSPALAPVNSPAATPEVKV